MAANGHSTRRGVARDPYRVLVVDDDDSVRELLSVLLQAEGLAVTAVSSGRAALAAAAEQLPDAITIDLAMPGMSGWELSRRLRDFPLTRTVPQLVISAHPLVAPPGEPELDVDAVLPKPFDLATFSRVVHELLPQAPADVPAPELYLPEHRDDGSSRHHAVGHYLRKAPEGARLPLLPSRRALTTVLRLVTQSTRFPMALVSLLDDVRQYPLAQIGVELPSVLPLTVFCSRVVQEGRPIVVEDAVAAVGPEAAEEMGLGTYVGVPLIGREGLPIGALCVLDDVAHSVGPEVVEVLSELAELAQDELELARREHELGVSRGADLRRELWEALADEQFETWYQPVVDLRTLELRSLEALVRWRHPQRGLLLPAAFLPTAEDTDLILEIDRRVLRDAVRDVSDLRRLHPALEVAVNVSGAHLARPEFGLEVRLALGTALPPSALVLELTESALVRGDGASARRLHELRALGVRVHLDDFGTGWNSLSQLLELPLDGLKVDRAFVQALGSTYGDGLVGSVVRLAHDLELELVVEGLETAWQVQRAVELGATTGQGHWFGAAMPVREIGPWLESLHAGAPGQSGYHSQVWAVPSLVTSRQVG